jgi:hypothetical protein
MEMCVVRRRRSAVTHRPAGRSARPGPNRLTRSLSDFAKLVELFDQTGVSFVSVPQASNITTSMGRLTRDVLLSFAQFEREVTGERIKAQGPLDGGSCAIGRARLRAPRRSARSRVSSQRLGR